MDMNGAPDEPRPNANDLGISLVRPYLMTAGRAEPESVPIEIEAQVATSNLGLASYHSLTFEHRDIVALCQSAVSVAEIAALLGLHIGVARVLVADLAENGYVVVRRPTTSLAHDRRIMERVIRGLEAIR
jgi:hypothetical protein